MSSIVCILKSAVTRAVYVLSTRRSRAVEPPSPTPSPRESMAFTLQSCTWTCATLHTAAGLLMLQPFTPGHAALQHGWPAPDRSSVTRASGSCCCDAALCVCRVKLLVVQGLTARLLVYSYYYANTQRFCMSGRVIAVACYTVLRDVMLRVRVQ